MKNLLPTFYKVPWESYLSSLRNKPFCCCYKMYFLRTLKFKGLFRKNFSKPLFRTHKYFKDFSSYFHQKFQIEPKLLPNFQFKRTFQTSFSKNMVSVKKYHSKKSQQEHKRRRDKESKVSFGFSYNPCICWPISLLSIWMRYDGDPRVAELGVEQCRRSTL